MPSEPISNNAVPDQTAPSTRVSPGIEALRPRLGDPLTRGVVEIRVPVFLIAGDRPEICLDRGACRHEVGERELLVDRPELADRVALEVLVRDLDELARGNRLT